MIELRVLGPIEFAADGVQLPALAPRQRRLVAALVAAGRAGASVAALAETIWGDAQPGNPVASLHSQVARLRRQLAPFEVIATAPGGYRLDADVVIDADAFTEQVIVARTQPDAATALTLLDAALTRWRGEPGEPDLDSAVLEPLAVIWSAQRSEAELRRAELLLALVRPGEAAAQLAVVCTRQPYAEQPVAAHMAALAADGRHSEALRSFDGFRRRLHEIGLVPSPALITLSGEIAAHTQPAARPRLRRPTSLIGPPTSFVGRAGTLDLLDQLTRRNRLVTIVGPGGAGKTRTALEWLARSVGEYSDGAWCCDLVAAPDPSAAVSVIAEQLSIHPRAGSTDAERIAEMLATRRAVLLLDNCEHVAAGLLTAITLLLDGAPSIVIVATSREPLGVVGEQLVTLAPLDHAVTPANTLTDSVLLFVDRARLVVPELALDDDALAAIQQICDVLGGLPLAIELVAARCAIRTLSELAGELRLGGGDRSTNARHAWTDLTGGERGRPERHRSVRSAIEWSYGLLPGELAVLLDEASVFAGGCDAGAAAAVLGPGAVAGLDELARRSLITTRYAARQRRYHLLEPVRHVAAARLAERQATPAVAERHAGWFERLAAETPAGFASPQSASTAERLEAEFANLRQAFEHLLVSDASRACRFAGSLFWALLSGTRPEIAAWAKRAIAAVDRPGPDCSLAAACAAVGAWRAGEVATSGEMSEQAVSLAGTDPIGRYAYEVRGDTWVFRGDFGRASQDYARAAALSRQVGDDLLLAVSLTDQAMASAHAGATAEAEALLDQSTVIAERLGNSFVAAFVAYARGELLLDRAPGAAVEHLRRAAALAEAGHSPFIWGVATLSAVSSGARSGRAEQAIVEHAALIDHWTQQGAWNQQWTTIRTLAEALAATGRGESAAVLLAAAEASATAPPIAGEDARRIAGVVEMVKRSLGPAAFDAAHARGAGLGDLAAVTFARDAVRSIAAAAT